MLPRTSAVQGAGRKIAMEIQLSPLDFNQQPWTVQVYKPGELDIVRLRLLDCMNDARHCSTVS